MKNFLCNWQLLQLIWKPNKTFPGQQLLEGEQFFETGSLMVFFIDEVFKWHFNIIWWQFLSEINFRKFRKRLLSWHFIGLMTNFDCGATIDGIEISRTKARWISRTMVQDVWISRRGCKDQIKDLTSISYFLS